MADAIEFSPPAFDGKLSERITKLDGGIVVPPPVEVKNRSIQKAGVLDADGNFIENSITWRNGNQVTIEPPMPDASEIVDMQGRHMFLGPLFGHFGHFLVESICRFWAFDQLRDELDGVVYVPKFQNRPEHVANVYRPFLEALGIDKPMENLAVPTRVETLYVPPQGFGMFEMVEGSEEFRAYASKFMGKGITPKGAEKIYISRSELPAARASILGEKLLEGYLEAEGYTVVHPQKHNHIEQIEMYRAATHVISIDGSPLHLLALVGQPGVKVGIIPRRTGKLDQMFVRQLTAFLDAEAHAADCLEANWMEAGANKVDRTTWGEISYSKLFHVLKDAGLIEGKEEWPDFDAATFAEWAAAHGKADRKPV